MDPNATLDAMVKLALSVIQKSSDPLATCDTDAEELAESALALHDWLSNGGFLPDMWRNK